MIEIYVALCALFKDFMAYISGRCTPMGMEKLCLE